MIHIIDLSMLIYRNVIITIADVVEVHVINLIPNRTFFSASQSGKYSVTLHFRSRELRFPEQCQKFLVECGKNLVEYGKNVRTPLIYSFHSFFKIKVFIRYYKIV
jgi:hypothetical protein